jgi:hypothetical protein
MEFVNTINAKLNNSRPRLRHRGWLVLGIVVLVGCDRSGLNLAPVEGVVTFNGAPLADAGVLFQPIQGPFAMGETDAEGRFTLITANAEGALIGDHRVSISKAETKVRHIKGNAMPAYDVKPLIPSKYFDSATSQLSAKVEDDDNHFEFNLTGQVTQGEQGPRRR